MKAIVLNEASEVVFELDLPLIGETPIVIVNSTTDILYVLSTTEAGFVYRPVNYFIHGTKSHALISKSGNMLTGYVI